jgi:hypothetical protein
VLRVVVVAVPENAPASHATRRFDGMRKGSQQSRQLQLCSTATSVSLKRTPPQQLHKQELPNNSLACGKKLPSLYPSQNSEKGRNQRLPE